MQTNLKSLENAYSANSLMFYEKFCLIILIKYLDGAYC